MGFFAVIDTETNWEDGVMSIGVAVADSRSFQPADSCYWILTPEYTLGGMYSDRMDLIPARNTKIGTRAQACAAVCRMLEQWGVRRMFAYNARFDRTHLPELGHLQWFDIMRIAAYRQYNPKIPADAPCCSTGRLKSRYGVEPMVRLLTGDPCYCETHNALLDALDELKIMDGLGLPLAGYESARL